MRRHNHVSTSADAALAQEGLVSSVLLQAYRAKTTIPVDIARAVTRRVTWHCPETSTTEARLRDPETLLLEAETLQRDFSGKPLPPLYGIPFIIDSDVTMRR